MTQLSSQTMTCCKCSYRFQPYYAKRTKVWLSGILPVRFLRSLIRGSAWGRSRQFYCIIKSVGAAHNVVFKFHLFIFVWLLFQSNSISFMYLYLRSVTSVIRNSQILQKILFPLFLEIKHASVFYFLLLVRHNNMNY